MAAVESLRFLFYRHLVKSGGFNRGEKLGDRCKSGVIVFIDPSEVDMPDKLVRKILVCRSNVV